jgi:hypothetical protein
MYSGVTTPQKLWVWIMKQACLNNAQNSDDWRFLWSINILCSFETFIMSIHMITGDIKVEETVGFKGGQKFLPLIGFPN